MEEAQTGFAAVKALEVPAPPREGAPRQRAAVLVVDDDEVSRYTTSRLLRQAGADVLEAATGAEALARAADRPDLVVLDVGLPDIDGIELCSRLKALPETMHTPILYLSARYPHAEDRIRGLEAGADAYLSQPVHTGELVATVRALLRSWWAGRALAESEARLTYERERLQSIFAQAPALISVSRGPEHRVEIANPLFRTVAGGGDPVGLPVGQAFPGFGGDRFAALVDEAYRTGTPYLGNELRVEVDGEERFFNFVLQPLHERSGGVSGVMTFAVEVTEQVRARLEVERKAEQLSRLTQALEASNRELDQFAYVISHDLKAPLRAIANYARYLEQDLADQLSGETRLYLERLRKGVERLQGMIEGVLAYSRAGRERVAAERVEVAATIQGIVELLSPPEGVSVEVRSEVGAIVTERAPLEQVLRNLIDNAIKHAGRPDTRIRVTVREAGPSCLFAVEDDGRGIDPELGERIWALFRTLDTTGDADGTGIGLAVVKRLVEARGGRVWVEPAPGGGVLFQFLWPMRSQVAA